MHGLTDKDWDALRDEKLWQDVRIEQEREAAELAEGDVDYQSQRIAKLVKQRDEALRAMGAAQDAMERARDERDELRDSLEYFKDVERENDELREKARRVDEADSRWEYMRRDLERMTAERDEISNELDTCETDNENLRAMLDELRKRLATAEAENERGDGWMKLPKDMNGEPIYLGDMVQFVNEHGGTGAPVEVCAVSEHYAYYGEGKHFYKASMCHHIKERTVEDVLAEFRFEASCVYDDPNIGGEDMADALYALDEKYADEIRELIGGDAR